MTNYERNEGVKLQEHDMVVSAMKKTFGDPNVVRSLSLSFH